MTQPLTIVSLIQMSFIDPRGTARMLTGWAIAPTYLWQALVAVVAASVAIEHIALLMAGGVVTMPPGGDELTNQIVALFETLYANPLYMAATQFGLMVITINAIHLIGRAFGGKGSHDDVLVMIVWFQVLVLGLQMLQILVTVIMPPLAGLVGIGTLAAFFYLLTMFVAELHGFRSAGMVLVGLIVSSVALLVAMSFIAAIIGMTFAGGA